MASTQKSAQTSPWMTLQQAAVYVAASVKTIRRRIASGELPAYLCGKRGMRVRREDLDNLMRPL
jgi:excisionase family DNA binding protein